MLTPIAFRPARRAFLARGLAGTLGLVFSPSIQRQLAAAEASGPKAKRCVVVWLNGGPSHIDTFDPKPGAATNGPFSPIDTAVAGVRICEHLPKLAAQANHWAFVRSLTSKEADHERAYQFLHTGNLPQETVEYPALGAVMARRWSGVEATLPTFVTINGSGASPGFFGLEYAPYVIEDPAAPFANITPPEGVAPRRIDRRTRALDAFERESAHRLDPAVVADHVRIAGQARSLLRSPALKALDITKEKPEVVGRYGAEGDDGVFGRGCLLARRLLEQGVRFVEVVLDGWDTHSDNFNTTKSLMGKLDPALSSLVGDLSERGLLDETLVVCVGEFGRTPEINETSGRDHWSDAFSAVLAGGVIRGGMALGSTDATGAAVKDRPVPVPDLFATLLSAFGIDGTKTYTTPEGRPIKLSDKGQVVRELFS
ncbi:MAG: DUF1501 domain-containing protein [Isosphaeraceae bacterium]|nr:DUF1501 domain-containing protein [Isosphaeraceae bacterium]